MNSDEPTFTQRFQALLVRHPEAFARLSRSGSKAPRREGQARVQGQLSLQLG